MDTYSNILKTLILMLLIGLVLVAVFFVNMPNRDTKAVLFEFDEQTKNLINLSINNIDVGNSLDINEKAIKHFNYTVSSAKPFCILHIGDSHVQADFFTGETRRLLSERFADGNTSRGFTFPYQIAGSNNPDDYEVTWKGEWFRNRADSNSKASLGLAGVAVSTSDAESEFTLRLKSGSGFDRVRVFFETDNQSVVPSVSHKWNFQSMDAGSATFHLIELADSISIGIDWNGVEGGNFTLYGFELINSGAKLIYHAAGVNGASVKTFLDSDNFSTQLKHVNPHLVIVSLGTNDAYNSNFNAGVFNNNLKELVSRIRIALPESIVILTTPGDHLVEKTRPNPNLAKVNTQIFSVANELGCGVWDFNSVMGGEGSIEKWFEMGLAAPDKLHLNRKGYKLKGALLFDALVKLTEKESKPTLVKTRLANE